ncbi:MAG: type II toxin-antitoxin system HicB family antitoxin [Chloroflexota bacterium]
MLHAGETVEECIERAREAIALHLEGMLADDAPIPEEAEHPRAIVIDVAA